VNQAVIALSVCFALLAYWALRRHLEQPRAQTALLFSLCGALGLLAHLSFIHFSLGALLWSTLVWLRRGRLSGLLWFTPGLVLIPFAYHLALSSANGAPESWLALQLERGIGVDLTSLESTVDLALGLPRHFIVALLMLLAD